MQIESLRVELRPRSPWEAVELGTALVRTHAAAIWRPWLLVIVSVFVVVNALALAVGHVWIAWLVMWWLKPVFDRIPLFVLSRAVFGEAPTVRATLSAQRTWGWRVMGSQLTWRRLSPWRALLMPVDLLEGGEPARLRERRRVLSGGVGGQAALLMLVCIAFVATLMVSVLVLAALLVPWEWVLTESARAAWALLFDSPPPWAQVALHALAWAATSAIEPFYIGAGFGLYLARRTQIEAWDVEIAFRRLRHRVSPVASAIVLLLAVVIAMPFPSHAKASRLAYSAAAVDTATFEAATVDSANVATDDGAADADDDRDEDSGNDASKGEAHKATRLADVFGAKAIRDPGFRKAVAEAYRDPLLRPTRTEKVWETRDKTKSDTTRDPIAWPWLANLVGVLGETGLWIVLGALGVVLLLTVKRWWPWLSGLAAPDAEPTPIGVSDALLPDVLPADIASAARALWAEGRPRRALALLYRASVDAMATRADVLLVPGATESECLRASRRMPDPDDRDAFARIVRTWQYAAYAQRLPAHDDFDGLVGILSQRFGWAR